MFRGMKFLATRWHWTLPALGIVLLTWSLHAFWQWKSPSGIQRLTVSGGGAVTSRQRIAGMLAREARHGSLHMTLCETAGTLEILEQLESGELDVGLISGGFSPSESQHVRQLATIGVEPLHLFVRADLLDQEANGLEFLRGRNISVGTPGSGVFTLSTELLEFCGLKPPGGQHSGDYRPICWKDEEYWARADAIHSAAPEDRDALIAKLPDAVFTLNPLPSRTAAAVASTGAYRLVPLDYSKSFRMNGAHHFESAGHRIDRSQIEAITIPAHVYGVQPAIPAADCPTFGVPLHVVVREGADSIAVERLLATIYDSPFTADMAPIDLLTQGAVYPLHATAKSYLEHRKPLAMKDVVEGFQGALSVFGAFSAGVFTVYGFYRRSRGRDPKTYLAEVAMIERTIVEFAAQSPSAHEIRDHLAVLEQQLAQLKRQLIQDYALGHSMGDSAFANLMTLIADTRTNLYRVAKQRPPTSDLRIVRDRPEPLSMAS